MKATIGRTAALGQDLLAAPYGGDPFEFGLPEQCGNAAGDEWMVVNEQDPRHRGQRIGHGLRLCASFRRRRTGGLTDPPDRGSDRTE
jgi:hypothetical protein